MKLLIATLFLIILSSCNSEKLEDIHVFATNKIVGVKSNKEISKTINQKNYFIISKQGEKYYLYRSTEGYADSKAEIFNISIYTPVDKNNISITMKKYNDSKNTNAILSIGAGTKSYILSLSDFEGRGKAVFTN